MLQQKNVHDRLYAGSSPKMRVKEARERREDEAQKQRGAATEACLRLHEEGIEQKKEALKRAHEKKEEEFQDLHTFQPKFPETPLFKAEKMTGSREEAWQRLRDSSSQKASNVENLQKKYEEEFQALHPFKPKLSQPGRTNLEEWLQMQKDWQKNKVERRAEKLQEKLDEEALYVQENTVHRNKTQVDSSVVCQRLYAQHHRQQERQRKRLMERRAEAQDDMNALHRKLDKSPAARQKVEQVVNRLYSEDREYRSARQQQRMKQKRMAEKAEDLLLQALSVHTPPTGEAQLFQNNPQT